MESNEEIQLNKEEICFLTWFDSQLMQLNDNLTFTQRKMGIKYFEDSERGALALKNLEPNEIILEVPRKLTLCKETALESEEIGGFFLENKEIFDSNPLLLLTTFLMYEHKKNSSSFWKSYFDILPQTFDTPLFWEEEDLKYAFQFDLYYETKALENSLKDTYEQLRIVFQKSNYQKNFPLEIFTYDEFKWAISIVLSRAFQKEVMLVPMADFMNHDTENLNLETTRFEYDQKLKVFRITATKKISNNEEIFTNYGSKTNTGFLLNFGIILLQNPNDKMSFQLSDSFLQKIPNFQEKEKYLNEKNLPSRIFKLGKHKLPLKLLVALRLYYLSEKATLSSSLKLTELISVENEICVFDTLVELGSQLYASYGSSIEGDKKLIDSNQLSSNAEIAVWYRKSQKTLLLSQLNKWKEILIQLKSTI